MVNDEQRNDRNQRRGATQTRSQAGLLGIQPGRKPYFVIDPGPLTCQTGIAGLEFDFNYGARVKVPEGDWRVRLTDREAAITLCDVKASNAFVTSTAKYFVRFGVEVYRADELVYSHDFSLAGKRVLIKFPVGTLEDVRVWCPHVQAFKDAHDCEVFVAMAADCAAALAPSYPELAFIGPDERPVNRYATYYIWNILPPARRC